MKPILAWVHESREQMEAVRKFIRSLEEGALDLLKFGHINERYAEIFFPGITTIMTKARYYIFVASACLTIEEKKKWGNDADEEVKRLENIIRKKLTESEEPTGIIGYVSKEELHSYPSDIYWGGLRTLGIFRGRDSKHQYYRRLKSQYLLRSEHQTNESQDEELTTSYAWDPRFEEEAMIDIEEQKKISFKLSKSESNYLKLKYDAYSEDYEPSLISWLLLEDTTLSDGDTWDLLPIKVNKSHTINENLRRHVEVAAHFRSLAGVLEQLYYVILCGRKWGLQSELSGRAIEYLDERVSDGNFQRSIKKHDTWLREATGYDPFFDSAVAELVKTNLNLDQLIKSRVLEQLIQERERLKGTKARLTNNDALEKWMTDDPRGGIPEFRLGVGLRIARDIREGLYAGS